MDRSPPSSSRQVVLLHFLYYRYFALGYAAFLGITGLRTVPVLSWIVAVACNMYIIRHRAVVLEWLQKRGYLILLDLLLIVVLEVDAGPITNPYYLYGYSPLFIGGFLFGYPGAVALAGTESALLIYTDYAAGDPPSVYQENLGLHFVTLIFFYFFFALMSAYLSSLLSRLEAAYQRRADAATELEKARKHLELSQSFNQLSLREVEVLSLSSQGSTTEQIARELGISINTVKTYLKRINDKLNVSSKQEAIALLMKDENESS